MDTLFFEKAQPNLVNVQCKIQVTSVKLKYVRYLCI